MSCALRLVVQPGPVDRATLQDCARARLYLRATRSGCRRLADLLDAAASSSVAIAPSSREARDLVKALNDHLAGTSNVTFEELRIDESLGPAIGPPGDWRQTSAKDGERGLGCVVVVALAVLATIVRGAVATWSDLVRLFR